MGSVGIGITCSIYCDCSVAATLRTVVYVVCFRYVIVNTVSTGGGGDCDCDDDTVRGMAQTVFRQSLNKEARVRCPVCP
jgi:hypothetical protein